MTVHGANARPPLPRYIPLPRLPLRRHFPQARVTAWLVFVVSVVQYPPPPINPEIRDQ